MKRGIWRGAVQGGMVLVVLLMMAAVVVSQVAQVKGAEGREKCLNNVRMIVLGMTQYAEDYDQFPGPLDSKTEKTEPVQYRLTKLIKVGYLTKFRVFHCPDVKGGTATDAPALWIDDAPEEQVARLFLNEKECSYGLDPRVKHTHSAGRVIIADRPHHDYWGYGVSSPEAGKPGSNSENHGGEGQNVAYNDGHVKWATTCADDSKIDPNIYGFNPEINPLDDSNIDFGTAPAK